MRTTCLDCGMPIEFPFGSVKWCKKHALEHTRKRIKEANIKHHKPKKKFKYI